MGRNPASLEWRVFCQLYRQTSDPVWGMFPHPPIGPIAKGLGITRGSVWRQLTALQRVGFLGKFEVIPNPALLGVGLRSLTVTVPDPRARVKLLEELEFVEGAMIALPDLGPRVNVIAVAHAPNVPSRTEEILKRMDGVEAMSRGTPVWLPPGPAELSLDSWKFISAVRQNPLWSFERLASHLGISSKTASKRYQTLRDERAMLSNAVEDFAKFPGVVVGTVLVLSPGTNFRVVAQSVKRLLPEALEAPSMTRPPSTNRSSVLAFLRMARNASETEQAELALLGIPGVDRVGTFFPGTARAYRHWFDARILEQISRPRPFATPHRITKGRSARSRPARDGARV